MLAYLSDGYSLSQVYTQEVYYAKRDRAYRHAYDHYAGPGESVYEEAM